MINQAICLQSMCLYIRRHAVCMGLLLALLAGSAAVGDEVYVGSESYPKATIIAVEGDQLTFRTSEVGKETSRPLSEVTRVKSGTCEELDQAEELFAAGQYSEAVKRYRQAIPVLSRQRSEALKEYMKLSGDPLRKADADAALARSRKGWRDALAKARIKVAKSRPDEAAPPANESAEPAKTGDAPAPNCPECKGSGRVECPNCHGTGMQKCEHCHGRWYRKCPYCDGAGKKTVTRTVAGPFGPVKKTVSVDCPHCEIVKLRTGEMVGAIWVCEHCKDHVFKGYQHCTVCDGEKTVPCPACCKKPEPETPVVVATTDADEPTTMPACDDADDDSEIAASDDTTETTTADGAGGWGHDETATDTPAFTPFDPDKVDPLSSPEMLARVIEYKRKNDGLIPPKQRDDWEEMTSMQRDAAQAEYEKKLKQRHEQGLPFAGKKIEWVLRINDIGKADGNRFVVRAESDKGHMITAYLPATQRDNLLQFKRNDQVQIAGTIRNYKFSEVECTSAPSFFGVEEKKLERSLGVLVDDASIAAAPLNVAQDGTIVPMGGESTNANTKP